MTDTTFLTSQVTSMTQTAGNTAHSANGGLQPAQTRIFATLMQAPLENTSSPGAPGAFSDMAAALTTRIGKTRSFEEIRHSMLASFDIHDPIGSMFAMTSDAMEAQMLFTRLHISTSLASAATSLFGSLLKGQQ
jgi:hypothetical protein